MTHVLTLPVVGNLRSVKDMDFPWKTDRVSLDLFSTKISFGNVMRWIEQPRSLSFSSNQFSHLFSLSLIHLPASVSPPLLLPLFHACMHFSLYVTIAIISHFLSLMFCHDMIIFSRVFRWNWKIWPKWNFSPSEKAICSFSIFPLSLSGFISLFLSLSNGLFKFLAFL